MVPRLARLLSTAAATLVAAVSMAAEISVPVGADVAAVVAEAGEGDVLRLAAGRHRAQLVIGTSMALVGEPGAVLQGPGQGSVVTVTAPDVRIEGLVIEGSGTDLTAMDAGVLVKQTAPRAQILANTLKDNLFGVYLHGAAGSTVRNNVISGRDDLRLSEQGNGVSIWNAPGAAVIDNRIFRTRDGIFVNTSRDNVFQGNDFSELRFAIHYMYTHKSRIVGNRSRGNHVAWAIMYSNALDIRDNVSENDRDHGLMLNTVNGSTIAGNLVVGGGEKCTFVYNANKNVISGNRFQGCPIGIHITAGSERNVISGNGFVANRSQVKYVSTRLVDWAHEGRGNYWSDNPAFDLDGDGIADQPYRPNDVMDELLWTLPQSKLLLNSPAVQMLRAAQSRFPALKPGGVVDSAPLMRPPVLAGAAAR